MRRAMRPSRYLTSFSSKKFFLLCAEILAFSNFNFFWASIREKKKKKKFLIKISN